MASDKHETHAGRREHAQHAPPPPKSTPPPAPPGGRRFPAVSPSVLAGAKAADIPPPTPEDIAGTLGAQVVLPVDSAARAGAVGVYPTIAENTLLRDAGYIEMGLNPHDPSGEATDPETPPGGAATPGAPTNTTVPAVTQTGTTLNCTMGTWGGEPTSYAYAWKLDDVAAGSDAATYEVQAGDVGKSATCVVTATNAAGSTAAPPSNAHVVT